MNFIFAALRPFTTIGRTDIWARTADKQTGFHFFWVYIHKIQKIYRIKGFQYLNKSYVQVCQAPGRSRYIGPNPGCTGSGPGYTAPDPG